MELCQRQRPFPRCQERLRFPYKKRRTPIISVDEATAYSGIGRTKLYELTTMENCPFVIWVGTRRVIKRKSFVEYLERQYSI